MKIYKTDDRELIVPSFRVEEMEQGTGKFVFEILEGPHQSRKFALENIHVSETDESLLEYNLLTEDGVDQESLKLVVDDIIISILLEQIERAKAEQNEDKTTE